MVSGSGYALSRPRTEVNEDVPFSCALHRRLLRGRHISDKLDRWVDVLGQKSIRTYRSLKRRVVSSKRRVEPRQRGLSSSKTSWRGTSELWRGVSVTLAALGELWRQALGAMRVNTPPKKHGIRYRTQWIALFFQRRLWQGLWRVRRLGLVPMWWHRNLTFPFPIDKCK